MTVLSDVETEFDDMVEERINRLEIDVVNLRVQHAELTTALDNLGSVVHELREVVGELRDTMNKGRGVIWLFGVGAVVLGGLVQMVMKKFLG